MAAARDGPLDLAVSDGPRPHFYFAWGCFRNFRGEATPFASRRSSAKVPAARKIPAAKPRRRAPAPKPYHHGDLRRVLIDAALQLVGEGGAEAVSVREAARRAGVSPGAPFRHFPSREALMSAVAEEAQRRFRAEIELALAEATAGDPLARFRRLGLAYMRWAMRNPTHFEIISSRRFFDHDKASRRLRRRLMPN